MNTKKRGKKRMDVVASTGEIWIKNLGKCFKEKNYTPDTFAKAYKEKYGTGNPTDARRWLNVGLHDHKKKIIGFPSYDTMKRIADFFGVTVGYLTGETDYETFEMERACTYLGIDERTGAAIRNITKGSVSTDLLCRFRQAENTAALCYLLTAPHFQNYIGGLLQLAADINRQKKPIHHLEETWAQLDPKIRDLALEWKDYNPEFEGESEHTPEWTPELASAIAALNEAEGKDYDQSYILDRSVQASKYNLAELNIRLIDEVLNEEHLKDLVGCQNTSPKP